ncbi:putative dehydrogenase [Acidovorax sp. 69]|uniref:Gfo/Idh/MocA family protein n=1 Tax=Acidovorax sp. 69 TaxID=2035202 RepID=UPI000C236EBB|nr:Gfo/Idh/MocA family oxidoreductase [Acidovorax sp. 69]PJI96815.1 putative dehydrogenase [Acidovorax sp. 69]
MALRVLVTGRGSIAMRHVRHLRQQRPDVVLGVVSGTGQVDASFEPCDILPDFAQGLRWKPDAVVIASVSSRHANELLACLDLGLPCLAEKPLVTQRAALAQLLAARDAARTQAAVLVGCNLRYLPVLARVRSMLRDGALGIIVRAHLEVGQALAQWRPARDATATYSADPELGGGVVFDLVHEIDMALWLLGPLTVCGAIGGRHGPLTIRSDDVHVALLQDSNCRPVTVSLDYVSCRPVRRYVFVGANGTLICDLMSRQLVLEGRTGCEVITFAPEDFDVSATYGLQMSDWLRALDMPAHGLTSPLADAFATADLMLSMKEAAT